MNSPQPISIWGRAFFIGMGAFAFASGIWMIHISTVASRISSSDRLFLQFVGVLFFPVSVAFLITPSLKVRENWPWIPWAFIGLAGLAASSFLLGWAFSLGLLFGPILLPILGLFGIFLYIVLMNVVVEVLQERQFRRVPGGFIVPRMPALRLLRRKRVIRFEEVEEAFPLEDVEPETVFLRLHDGTVLYLSEKRGVPSEFMSELVHKAYSGRARGSRHKT